jgi:hypothetical protein
LRDEDQAEAVEEMAVFGNALVETRRPAEKNGTRSSFSLANAEGRPLPLKKIPPIG